MQTNRRAGAGPTRSLWVDTAELLERPPLRGDLRTDVCVVGAGLAGMSVAYMLARSGREVVVLDDGPIGGGETSHTTAHLTNILDDRYHDVERRHGERGARISAESHTAAIDAIEAIARNENIACDFERLDGYLFVPPGDPIDELDEELDAARRAGIAGVQRVERAPIAPFHTNQCLRFRGQAMFHPLRYVAGLARALEARGGRIHGGTHVTEIEGDRTVEVRTADGARAIARSVVVATNAPIHQTIGVHAKQAPYRTYAIGAAVPRGTVTRALYYDTPWPYHYVRLHTVARRGHEPQDVLIVGGEDHKSGHDPEGDPFARLEAWARERFPAMERVEWTWSGQVMEPMDGIAFIGRDPDRKNVYLASGDSGMGMTHGTIAGLLISDLITGRENSWVRLYDPSRTSLRAAGRFLKESLDSAGHLLERITPGEVSSVDEIAPGAGAVMRRGTSKVAVYRDRDGTVHEVSAICPHLGCVVGWNAVERSWDCPCHGSRFDPHGQVITGPATGNLEPVERREERRKDERAA